MISGLVYRFALNSVSHQIRFEDPVYSNDESLTRDVNALRRYAKELQALPT